MGKKDGRYGAMRSAWDKAKRRVLREQDVCGICGMQVDKSLKFPDPMSATVDHIIPVARGGHPVAMENLQLAHLCCNRAKSDRLCVGAKVDVRDADSMPWTFDWANGGGCG